MVVACIALLVALGGTSYAAIRLPANSVGTNQLKNNAVTSLKVKNNAITGADIKESAVAKVPRANIADFATDAQDAVSAASAANAAKLNGVDASGYAAAATVVRYAIIWGAGSVSWDARGVTPANVTHPADGVNCISGLNPAPHAATTTFLYGAGVGSEVYVKISPTGADQCAGSQIGVLTYDVTTDGNALLYALQNKPFAIAIY